MHLSFVHLHVKVNAAMPNKPKLLQLTEKAKIIEELHQGARVTPLSKKYGVAKSTICKIKKNKEQILSMVHNTFVRPGNRKTCKIAKAPRVESDLYKWFLNQRAQDIPVSCSMLKEAAIALNETLKEVDNFFASDGWLRGFKNRYGIGSEAALGKKLPEDCEFPEVNLVSSKKLLGNPQIIEVKQELDLNMDQIIEADDIGQMDTINLINDGIVESDDDKSHESIPIIKNIVTDAQAVQVFNEALDWAEENGASYSDITVLRKLRSWAMENSRHSIT